MSGCGGPPEVRRPHFTDLVRRVSPAVVGVGDDRGVIGSGFVAATGREVVTAAHVVAEPRGTVQVVHEGRRWPAVVSALDRQADLALLRLPEGVALPGLPLLEGPEGPPAGEWILVLGRPFGTQTAVTAGIVSATPGTLAASTGTQERLLVNASVNPGNSGGPVVDLEGRVVGVASATLPAGQGLALVAPASAVRALLSRRMPPR